MAPDRIARKDYVDYLRDSVAIIFGRLWSWRKLVRHGDQLALDALGNRPYPPIEFVRDKALVLCVDEKSQIQALERTQPVLPMGLGAAYTG